MTQITNNGTQNTEPVGFSLGNRKIEMEVPAGRADLIWSDKDNQILGVFNQGDFLVNGQVLVSNGALSQVFAKDGKDLSQSKYLVVTPQYTGKTVIASKAEWSELSVSFGQLTDGQFRKYGDVAFTKDESGISFDITEDMRNRIILITEKAKEEKMMQSIVESMIGKTVVSPEKVTTPGIFGGESGKTWKIVLFSTLGVVALAGAGVGTYFGVKKSQKRKKNALTPEE